MPEIDKDSPEVAEQAPQDSTAEVPQEGAEAVEAPQEGAEAADAAETPAEGAEGDADTFPREYVEQLRTEAKERREAAAALQQELDTLKRTLWALQVEKDGRLADPSDLPFEDGADVSAAVSALLEAKPHYGKRPGALPEQEAADAAPSGPTFAELLRTL